VPWQAGFLKNLKADDIAGKNYRLEYIALNDSINHTKTEWPIKDCFRHLLIRQHYCTVDYRWLNVHE
jgi:hypothetical protein